MPPKVGQRPEISIEQSANVANCLARLSEAESVIAEVRQCLASLSRQPEQLVQHIPLDASDNVFNLEPSPRSEIGVSLFNSECSVQQVSVGVLEDRQAQNESSPTVGSIDNPITVKECTAAEREYNVVALKATFPELAEKFNITEAKVQHMYEIFTDANTCKSGFLLLHELEELLMNMCDCTIEEHQLHFIMTRFDVDTDGMLSFAEFIDAFVNSPLTKAVHLHDEIRDKGNEHRSQMQKSAMRLQPEDWVNIIGCKVSTVKQYVQKEMDEAGSCLAMPLVFLMFIVYYLSCHFHLGYEELHSVDQAIYFDITENANFAFGGEYPYENGRMGHKNIFDVNSFGDFWSWLDLGITPIFWMEGWDLSETRSNLLARCTSHEEGFENYGWEPSSLAGQPKWTNSSFISGRPVNTSLCSHEKASLPKRPGPFYANADKGTYLYYNSVVGGVRLRQERSSPEECPNTDGGLRSALHDGVCLPGNYALKPEVYTSVTMDEDLVDRPNGRTVYLPALAKQSDIRATLRKLENDIWLSPYTAKIEVLLTTYNAHLDIFTATYVWIFLNRGGHMYKVLEPISTYLTTYRTPVCYVLDITLLLLCLKIMVDEIIEISKACKLWGFRTGLKEYLQPANFVDWLSALYFLMLMGIWLNHMNVISGLQDAMRVAKPTQKGSFSSEADRDHFYDTLDSWVVHDRDIRLYIALFPFVIGMRFFKVFSLQPRLGVVTATLKCSCVDFIHFTVVFASIFFVFVASAMILFGQELDEYANFGRAVMATFRAMLGDYDWDELIRTGRQSCGLWFWVFTWLVNLIMLNMLLAIIMDVYTEVKGQIAADSETMWSQVMEILGRWYALRTGKEISLQKVWVALHQYELKNEENEEEFRLTLSSLMSILPEIPEPQALRLLVSAFGTETSESVRGLSMSETSIRVQHIFANTQAAHTGLEQLMRMTEMMAELLKTHFAEMRYQDHHNTRAIIRTKLPEVHTPIKPSPVKVSVADGVEHKGSKKTATVKDCEDV